MSQFLNMSLDDYIKASKNKDNGKNNNENPKNFNFRIKKKPIRKFQNQNPKNNNQASSFKNNNSNNSNYVPKKIISKLHTIEAAPNYKRIKIENLDKNIDNSELRELFEQCGKLVKLGIEWDDIGRSLGSAIVEYDNENGARTAIESYDGAELDGLVLKVDYEHKTLKKKNL